MSEKLDQARANLEQLRDGARKKGELAVYGLISSGLGGIGIAEELAKHGNLDKGGGLISFAFSTGGIIVGSLYGMSFLHENNRANAVETAVTLYELQSDDVEVIEPVTDAFMDYRPEVTEVHKPLAAEPAPANRRD